MRYVKERCPCGNAACRDWHIRGFGKYVQGSGFTEAQADWLLTVLQNRETILEIVQFAFDSDIYGDLVAEGVDSVFEGFAAFPEED